MGKRGNDGVRWVVLRGGVALWAGLLLPGCPNPNVYSTPRTVEPGKASVTVAPEVIGWSFTRRTTNDDGSVEEEAPAGGIVLLPTAMVRLGLTDRLEVGGRLNHVTTLGADLKYNFYRGTSVDLAVDPGGQYLTSEIYHLHLPLIVGFNFSEHVSLVVTPGVMYGVVGDDESNAAAVALRHLLAGDGLYARVGLGVDVRVTERFAIQPEVTALSSLENDREPDPDSDEAVYDITTWVIGVGFKFGRLPSYGDLAEVEP